MGTITFRTKVRHIREADGTQSEYIPLKKTLTRQDCDLKPHQHSLYNTDFFPSVLMKAYRRIVGERTFVRLSELPDGVTVDTSGFLAVVTVSLPESFR